jgi:hypothetical protein
MVPKLGKNAIYVDVDALRRGKRTAIDLKRIDAKRDADEIDLDVDPLAAIIALARRRTGR